MKTKSTFFLDKPILKELFWFWVLPQRLKEDLKSNPNQTYDWYVEFFTKTQGGTERTELHLHNMTYTQAKQRAGGMGWTEPKWWQVSRWGDTFCPTNYLY